MLNNKYDSPETGAQLQREKEKDRNLAFIQNILVDPNAISILTSKAEQKIEIYNQEKTLCVQIRPKKISIFDNKSLIFKVACEIIINHGRNYFSINVISKKDESYIWPKAFITLIFKHLDQLYGIDRIGACWMDDSKNFDIFMKEMKAESPEQLFRLSKSDTNFSQNARISALQTWTGKLATSLGYNDPQNIEVLKVGNNIYRINAEFVK